MPQEPEFRIHKECINGQGKKHKCDTGFRWQKDRDDS